MKHLTGTLLFLISTNLNANISMPDNHSTLSFQQLFTNEGTKLDKLTTNNKPKYGARINGMDLSIMVNCNLDYNVKFPMGIEIETQHNLSYQADFMEPNFGIIQLEYAVNNGSKQRIAHQGAEDMMSSSDFLLNPDKLSRFRLSSGHSVFNQIMHQRQQYLQGVNNDKSATKTSHNLTVKLPIMGNEGMVTLTINPFHTSWLEAYNDTCHKRYNKES